MRFQWSIGGKRAEGNVTAVVHIHFGTYKMIMEQDA